MKKFTLLVPVLMLCLGVLAQQRQTSVIELNKKDDLKLDKKSHVVSSNTTKSKAYIFSEGFEESSNSAEGILPTGWTVKRSTTMEGAQSDVASDAYPWFRNSADYHLYTSYANYIRSGEASLMIYWNLPNPSFTWAISPEISVPSGTNPIYMTYYHWYNNADDDGWWYTNYYIRVREVGQETWTTVQSFLGPHEETESPEYQNYFDLPLNVDLSAYAGKNIQFAFVYEFTDGWQLAIDDITIYEIPNNDFSIDDALVYPYFALTPDSVVTIYATVNCNGLTEGQPTVYLKVNGVDESSVQVSTDLFYGESEDVELTFSPTGSGKFVFDLYLAEDEISENNTFKDSVNVYQAVTLAEDYENIDWTDPENPEVIFPPAGWTQTENERDWDWTSTYAIDRSVSARCAQMNGDPVAWLKSPKVTFQEVNSRRPVKLTFWTSGVNNSLTVSEVLLGHSTMIVKYSTDAETWTDLFTFEWDDPAKNSPLYHEIDISEIPLGEYYFAFTTTSTFDYSSGGTTYYSHAIIDNVLIYEDGGTSVVSPTLINLSAYPNPFDSYITINNPSMVNRVVITNLLGQKVLDIKTNGAQQIETASLPTGIYLVSFEVANGESVVRKMVKR